MWMWYDRSGQYNKPCGVPSEFCRAISSSHLWYHTQTHTLSLSHTHTHVLHTHTHIRTHTHLLPLLFCISHKCSTGCSLAQRSSCARTHTHTHTISTTCISLSISQVNFAYSHKFCRKKSLLLSKHSSYAGNGVMNMISMKSLTFNKNAHKSL